MSSPGKLSWKRIACNTGVSFIRSEGGSLAGLVGRAGAVVHIGAICELGSLAGNRCIRFTWGVWQHTFTELAATLERKGHEVHILNADGAGSAAV